MTAKATGTREAGTAEGGSFGNDRLTTIGGDEMAIEKMATRSSLLFFLTYT